MPPANNVQQVSLFLGNITTTISDIVIRQILVACGKLTVWNRMQESAGKLGNFGFCDYEDPDSALRALRLVNGLRINGQELQLKADAKVRELLDTHKKLKGQTTDTDLDDETKSADERAKDEIRSLIHTANRSVRIEFGPPTVAEPKKPVEPEEQAANDVTKLLKEARESAQSSSAAAAASATAAEEKVCVCVKTFMQHEANFDSPRVELKSPNFSRVCSITLAVILFSCSRPGNSRRSGDGARSSMKT